jgi:hypothetical protein
VRTDPPEHGKVQVVGLADIDPEATATADFEAEQVGLVAPPFAPLQVQEVEPF